MMIKQIKKLWIALVAQLFIAKFAFAQAGGFAAQASTMLENVRDGIVIVVGVVATIALLWQLAEGFMGRKTWADVLTNCLWIFGAGAAVAAGTWIFTSGQSISF